MRRRTERAPAAAAQRAADGPRSRPGNPPARIRIIGGLWKRTPLPVPDLPGLRPTSDRVRETLFNWLGQDLTGRRCLDPFAGSGALGFEAASRGAARVVMIDREPRALASMRRLRDRLGATAVELVQADAIEWLRAAGDRRGGFDVVFLDPPFGRDWLRRALPLVVPLLAPGARVYVEAEAALHALLESLPEGLTLARAQRAGQVHYHLLQYELSPREPDSWQLPSTPARSTR